MKNILLKTIENNILINFWCQQLQWYKNNENLVNQLSILFSMSAFGDKMNIVQTFYQSTELYKDWQSRKQLQVIIMC